MTGCTHPKELRSLPNGYDVVCECGEAVGRVALFPCAVLTRPEAYALLEQQDGKSLRDAHQKLRQALRSGA